MLKKLSFLTLDAQTKAFLGRSTQAVSGKEFESFKTILTVNLKHFTDDPEVAARESYLGFDRLY